MMAQSDLVVVGIDVAKDKVDACIRSLSQRQTFPSTPEGRRALIRWLRKHKVGKAAMEASGGYERDWAKALREAGIEALIVDPKRVRNFARSAGRLAKNDPIDAEVIAWFAETFVEAKGQAYDAAREKLVDIVNARQALLDMQTGLQNRSEHSTPEVVQKMQARLLKNIALEVAKLEAAIAAMIKATPHFAERAEIIESVPGLGKGTSAGLIAAIPQGRPLADDLAYSFWLPPPTDLAPLRAAAPVDLVLCGSRTTRRYILYQRTYEETDGTVGFVGEARCNSAHGGCNRSQKSCRRRPA